MGPCCMILCAHVQMLLKGKWRGIIKCLIRIIKVSIMDKVIDRDIRERHNKKQRLMERAP